LRLLLLGIEYLLQFSGGFHNDAGIFVFAFLFLFAHVLIYTWQVVGLLRACDRYQRSYGGASVFWAVCLGIVASLLFTVSSLFSSAQIVFNPPSEEETHRPRPPAYTLHQEGALIVIRGEFSHGLTREFDSLYLASERITGVILESHGGNTFVGRGVAHIIRKHGLETHVVADCFSACATAFIAGRTRMLGPEGRLGFHQYGIDSDREIPFADAKREQEVDRTAFAAQGIAQEFLAKIFDAPRSEIWIPTAEELLAAGVVHRIAEP